MTAVLDASHEIIDCPHCKGKVKVEVEREPATVKLQKQQSLEDLEATIEKAIEKRIPKQEKKEEKPPEVKTVAPAYQPKHLCKGKDCEGHKNPNYSMRVKKKCTQCDQFAPDSVKKCPWCDNDEFDDLDDDDLDSMGIPKPEHDHEHE